MQTKLVVKLGDRLTDRDFGGPNMYQKHKTLPLNGKLT